MFLRDAGVAVATPNIESTDRLDTQEQVLEQVAAGAAAQRRAENFPVALRLLPARVTRPLIAVYGFARFVDDVGDEAPGDRLALLAQVRADVLRLAAGTSAQLSPVAALRPVLDAGVPVEPLLDLVAANVADQSVSRYATFDDLLGYCRLSANPVGRVVLHLAVAASAENVADSDDVCTGLQVLEHSQDVGEDARAGRIYLPAIDRVSAGVADADLLRHDTSEALREVVALQVRRARELLASGPPLVRRLSGWARIAVSGYVAGGLATADALSRADYDVLARCVRPTKRHTVRYAVALASS